MVAKKASLQTGTNEQKVVPELDPEVKHFVFKSKYKEDRVTLKKGTRELMPDGTAFVSPPVVAEFGRNTWATDDANLAGILRDIIGRRLLTGAPIHILETTDKE